MLKFYSTIRKKLSDPVIVQKYDTFVFSALFTAFLLAPQAHAQWTNHYPKLDDFGHHVYLEQHELPILTHGPMDPAPAPDGKTLSFAAQGWIWFMNLETGEATRITSGPGMDARPRWSPDGKQLAFVRDTGDDTSIVLMDIGSGSEQIINTPAIDLDPESSGDGQSLYYTSGESGSLELRRHHLEVSMDDTLTQLPQVVRNTRRMAGGSGILYLHGAGAHRVLRERNFVEGTDHIVHRETLTYHLTADATYVDPQTGRHYFYVEHSAEFTLPEGRYTVLAARGPMTPVVETDIQVRGGDSVQTTLSISEIWDAGANGYMSADHHVHLNGDGHHRATHKDALRLMAGESLDHLAPMSWNRWERRIDRSVLGKETTLNGRTVHQGQEVRSHFHGHIGLLNVETPFTPWFFGPYNPTLGDPDLTNGDVFEFADQHGAFATYVHPISSDRDPFTHLQDGPIPLELISDGVLAERMGIELVCAWTSPLGNAEVWYRLLNIGQPIAAMSGTDGWVDFHRTPAMGTGRTYVRTRNSDRSSQAVIEAAASGRSFVTTGPALIFELDDGSRPGDVTSAGSQSWKATLASTTGIDLLEIIVNGKVVEQLDGVQAGETRTFTGQLDLPDGGWIAARAYAAEQKEDSWPSMHARPYAHSSPIWIGEIGSTEPGIRAEAAADLIRAIDAAEIRAREAYGDVEMNRMLTRFDKARTKLREMIE